MIRIVLTVAALVGPAALAALPAHGASFDCARAEKADEIAICGDADLSALDSEMGALWYAYSKVPMLMGGSGARHDEAEAFLQKRSSCAGDVGCLAEAYRQRISSLKGEFDAAMGQYAQLLNAPSAPDTAIASLVSGYADQCAALGGALATAADQPRTMTADLDDDGLPDYVLNTEGLQCSGSATAFCGNAGCRIDIALSSQGFTSPISALGGQPTLVQSEAGTRLQVWVDGTHCGLRGDSKDACWATYAWTDGQLAASYSRRREAD